MDIMLVDDFQVALESLHDGILSAGHQLNNHDAFSEDWVAKVIYNQPDLLMLSCHAPDKPLFAAIKALKEQLPIPIILFSDNTSKDLIKQAYCAGVDEFMDDTLCIAAINTMINATVARFEITHTNISKIEDDESCPAVITEARNVLMYLRHINESEAMSTLQKMSSRSKRDIREVAQSIVTLANHHA